MDEVIPLLDAVGGQGMYISVNSGGDRAAVERLAERVEAYRDSNESEGISKS